MVLFDEPEGYEERLLDMVGGTRVVWVDQRDGAAVVLLLFGGVVAVTGPPVELTGGVIDGDGLKVYVGGSVIIVVG